MSKKVFTIPNILSMLRICMIPVFMHLYIAQGDYTGTAIILLLSGLTDTADGFIARHFNMISDLGKALDPVADKLTQAAMLLCLLSRFPLMIIPLLLLVVKEISSGVMSLMVIRRTNTVTGADWHGKVNTCLLYAMAVLHLVWPSIPAAISNAAIYTCTAMMLVSFALYTLRNIRALTAAKKEKNELTEEKECCEC